MNVKVTLWLDDDLARKVRKIAVERKTTLTAMVRRYLEKVAAEDSSLGRKRREREALEHSFQKFQFKIGKRNWTREDLHARS
jgi:predicted transcriptional regulator